jgi:multidrug efflux system membrane fusion protein
VQVGVLPKVVTVPLLAVQHGPDGLFVYTVKPDKTVDQANVEVGYQDADLAVITKGLSGNETVVVAGQSRLAPGVRVQATGQPAAAQASAGGASPT